MRLTLVNGPVGELVSFQAAKLQCRVDHDDEDELIDMAIQSAISYLDGYRGILGRCILTQTWRIELPRLGQAFALPFPDISTVTGDFTDAAAGAVDFATVDVGTRSTIRVRSGFGRPAAFEFAAGFGKPADVPPAIRQAVLMLTAFFYRRRGDDAAGGIPPEIMEILSPFVIRRV